MIDQLYIIIPVILFVYLSFIWIVNRKLSAMQDKLSKDNTLIEWLRTMQVSLDGTNKNVTDSLARSTRVINERLDNAARYISQVAQEVGKMSELGKSMRDLQLFLQSPKLRGNIGEQVLKDMISQAFPKGSFFLQYAFKSGEKVDAAIKTTAGIIPIDSKFPMENFRLMTVSEKEDQRKTAKKDFGRDVRKHILDIAQKYINPGEGTMDFAFMYLPSETVFYEVANDQDLMDYARKYRIYPVSPNTLYVHLQTVLLSFEGQKIESKTRQVFRLVRALHKDYEKTNESFQVLGKHLNNAYNQYANVDKSFSVLGQKLSSGNLLSEANDPDNDRENT